MYPQELPISLRFSQQGRIYYPCKQWTAYYSHHKDLDDTYPPLPIPSGLRYTHQVSVYHSVVRTRRITKTNETNVYIRW